MFNFVLVFYCDIIKRRSFVDATCKTEIKLLKTVQNAKLSFFIPDNLILNLARWQGLKSQLKLPTPSSFGLFVVFRFSRI